MAEKIKGITIEFNADTSGMKKALQTLNAYAKKTNTTLNDVNRALKLKPNSVTLLTQKQRLLRQRTEEVTDKLLVMRTQLKQMKNDPSVDKKSVEFQKLQRDIVRTTAYQKQFAREMLKFGNAKFNAVGGSLQSVGRSLTNITRRARMAAGAIAGIALYKGFERLKVLDDVSTELKKLGYRGQKLENVMNAAKGAVSGTKYALTDMSKVAKGALGAGVESKFELADYLQRVADLAAVGGTSVSQMGALMNKALSKGTVDAKLLNQMNANGIPIYNLLAESLGVTTEELSKMVKTGQVGFEDLYKATEKYKGIAQELGTETFSGAVTVLGQQFGLLGADFLDGAYGPIKEGVQGIVLKLRELQNNGTIKKWGTAVGDAVRYFVEWFKTGEGSIDDLSGKAQGIVKVFSPVVKVIGMLVKAFMALPTPLKEIVAGFVLLGGPLLIFVGGLVKVIGVITNLVKVFQVLGGAFKAFSVLLGLNPVVLGIVAAIAALVAIGVVLYKNWDTIKAKAAAIKTAVVNAFSGLAGKVKTAWNAVKNAITKPITDAKDKVKKAIDTIKGLFPLKIGKIFSNLKLPHFTVKGGKAPYGLMGKGTKPSISVKWYKQGGIFDGATLAGIGEAGPEAVVPLSGRQMQPFAQAIADNFQGGFIDYDRLAAAIINGLANVDTSLTLVLDGKPMATQLAPYMNSAINQIQARQERQLGFV